MAEAFAVILAVLKAIPAIKDAFDQFLAWYVARELEQMRQANRDGIRKAVKEHDQRELEKAIGSPIAGEPSGHPGSVVRDQPPRLR